MKPLDFIITKNGKVGMITEVRGSSGASIEFLHGFGGEKTAWWDADEFMVIDNLPDLLSRNLSHPSGVGSFQPFKTEGES